jgi:hypothetical protein
LIISFISSIVIILIGSFLYLGIKYPELISELSYFQIILNALSFPGAIAIKQKTPQVMWFITISAQLLLFNLKYIQLKRRSEKNVQT